MPLFSFLRQSGRIGASELVQSVSSIYNFLPLTNNSPKLFTLCDRNNSNQTSMLKIPLEKSIHPFFRPFVHASPLTQAFSASNIHPSIRPLVIPSHPPIAFHPSVHPVIDESVRPSNCQFVCPSFCPSVCLSIPPFDLRSARSFVRFSVHLYVGLTVRPSVPLSVYLSVRLLICPSVPPPVRLSIHLSTNESLTNIFRLSLITHTIDFFKKTIPFFPIAHGLPSRPQC